VAALGRQVQREGADLREAHAPGAAVSSGVGVGASPKEQPQQRAVVVVGRASERVGQAGQLAPLEVSPQAKAIPCAQGPGRTGSRPVLAEMVLEQGLPDSFLGLPGRDVQTAACLRNREQCLQVQAGQDPADFLLGQQLHCCPKEASP